MASRAKHLLMLSYKSNPFFVFSIQTDEPFAKRIFGRFKEERMFFGKGGVEVVIGSWSGEQGAYGMKIVSLKEVEYFSRLGQNIFRHDGLLALPKGITLREKELREIEYYGIDYIIAYDKTVPIGRRNDINFTLSIVESAFMKTTLWEKEFGDALYEYIRNQVIHNEKVIKYLNKLRSADSYSFAHCINISIVVTSLLSKNIKDMETLGSVAFFALVHDVGRLKMLDLFNKKGKLTPEEFNVIKMHPKESFIMLKKAGFIDGEIEFVTETHEKFNGTGYPYKLRGEEISMLGQLILIADVYNALSSFRPYRDSYTPHQVSVMIDEEKGKSFGEGIVRYFKENFEPYKKGMLVILNTDELARVVSTRYSKTLPVVEIIDEDSGERIKRIDLSSQKEYRIKRIANV